MHEQELEGAKAELDRINAKTGIIYFIEVPVSTLRTDRTDFSETETVMKVGMSMDTSLSRLNAYGASRVEHRILRMPLHGV